LTFGSDIQAVVIVNFDLESSLVQAVRYSSFYIYGSTDWEWFNFQVQFLYATAILLSTPLQLFPALRIMENGLFARSGKADFRVKWMKNIFRFITLLVCSAVSWAGAADLDKFVAFVGSFAWFVLFYFLLKLQGCRLLIFLVRSAVSHYA
jgi:proton-coupled amino acid transporter